MQTLWQDLRYAARMLLKKPGFTIVAVVTLALGIGANTAIFSVVNGVLLRPLPFKEPEQLVRLWETSQRFSQLLPSAPNLKDWQEQNTVFTQIGAYMPGSYNLLSQNNPDRVSGAAVSAEFFEVLGVAPELGRTLTKGEDEFGRQHVVVLSDQLWRRSFAAAPNIIGASIDLNGKQHTVIGVMPPTFRYPQRDAELWTPLVIPPKMAQKRGAHGYWTVARLKPGVTLTQAREQLKTIAGHLAEQYRDTNSGHSAKVEPMQETLVKNLRPGLMVLSGAVAFVLMIACINVAGLLLSRTLTRRRENAVRVALGAGRGRLIRQYLTESLLLALLSGLAGLLVARWAMTGLLWLAAKLLPPATTVTLDARVAWFTLLLSLLTGIVCGLIPAWRANTTNLVEDLKEGSGASEGPQRHRLRGALVIAEVACALVLLTGAGLLIRSFWRLQNVDSGLKTENVLTMKLALPETKYGQQQKITNFYQQLLERVSALPGVKAAGVVTLMPLQEWGIGGQLVVLGPASGPAQPSPFAEFRAVSPDYFRVVGMRLLAGRFFDQKDQERSPQVAIINQALANSLFPGQDAVGRRLQGNTDEGILIVGVVSDVKQISLLANASPELYAPVAQSGANLTQEMSLMVKASGDPLALTPAVRQAVLAVDPVQPVYAATTLEAVVAGSFSDRRLNMLLLSVLASVALFLAVIGLYGVMSSVVTQSTREIGIRIALGAQNSDVLKLIVGQGLILTMAGVALGVAGAFALTRLMATLLYGVTPTDPLTFTGVSILLLAVALLASYLPARRAMKADPLVALRYE